MFESFNELKEKIESYREKIKSGEKKAGRWKKRWQHYSSKFQLFMFLFTVTGFVFFNYSRLFFKDDSPIIDSGVGEVSQTKIGSSDVAIVSRKINNSTGYGEVMIYVEETSDQVHKEYVSYAGETKNEQPIKTKLQAISENYYLVQLYNVPKNWKGIVLDFGYNAKPKAPTTIEQMEEQKKQESRDYSQQTTFHWDVRKSKSTETLKEKTKENYLSDVITLEEKATKEKDQLLVENTKNIEEEIKKIEQNINKELQEMRFKVGKEKDVIQSKITQLEREKEKYIETMMSIKNEQTLLKEKLEKLKEKKEQVTQNR